MAALKPTSFIATSVVFLKGALTRPCTISVHPFFAQAQCLFPLSHLLFSACHGLFCVPRTVQIAKVCNRFQNIAITSRITNIMKAGYRG